VKRKYATRAENQKKQSLLGEGGEGKRKKDGTKTVRAPGMGMSSSTQGPELRALVKTNKGKKRGGKKKGLGFSGLWGKREQRRDVVAYQKGQGGHPFTRFGQTWSYALTNQGCETRTARGLMDLILGGKLVEY